ncbi:transposase-like protein [Erythromicrobium ramosum]|jgi:hypothetical protein|uniref:Transposase-like protein n=1 Tax=Erythrobacter ramosus TaxID=35811 RepID=A0A6I4UH79_9SPHN|nr:hypothetical protein [Erythrobacter ramosus]MBB3775148.1 transposase-like protein [Erythrobacter ramosus]MXP37224.1 hypothetical protein [Erythrobacter ramosus]
MAIYPIEAAVLKLSETGLPPAQIACRLGIKAKTVLNIRDRFSVNIKQERKLETKLRSQSKRFGDLLRKAGGHR